MKAILRQIDDHGRIYQALMFWCPGCERLDDDGTPQGGLHMLPVSGDVPSDRARWDWDGNLEQPTLSPSILTRGNWRGEGFICHSYLRGGSFEFLGDCTHELAGQTVEARPLPQWAIKEAQ